VREEESNVSTDVCARALLGPFFLCFQPPTDFKFHAPGRTQEAVAEFQAYQNNSTASSQIVLLSYCALKTLHLAETAEMGAQSPDPSRAR